MVIGKDSKKEFLTDVLLEIKMEYAMEKCLEFLMAPVKENAMGRKMEQYSVRC